MNRRQFVGTSALGLLASTIGAVKADERQEAAILENEQIQKARAAALDILKPSQKDLEHGLDLHAQSLVFDSYGFAPRAALDGDEFAKQVEQGASAHELKDLREEMSMTRCVTSPVEREEFLMAWRAAGVTCIFQNAGEEGQDPLLLLKRLARFTYVTDMLRPVVRKASTPADILKAKEDGQHCLYLTGNGVPLAQDWHTVEEELSYVRLFYQLGIRMMHVTYQRRNMLGDGCGEPGNAGLSDFGRAALAEMNRVGVIIDVAHSGWRTSLESAQVSQKPMVASHTTCAGLYNHFRGKPDEVIRAIADTGGLIGICCIPRFLGGKGDINALLDHIDYAVKKFGVDHVAIGTDIAYTSRNAAQENRKVPRLPKRREEFRSLWPKDFFTATPQAQESLSWTNWPLFTVGLVQRGYSDQDIQKILGLNMLRVCREVLT